MPDDPRDKYTPKHQTPPGGIRNRRPISQPESWEDDASYTPIGSPDKPTPVGMAIPRTISDSDMLASVARRSGETKNVAIDTKRTAITTLDRVDGLRRETREDIGELRSQVGEIAMVVGELREDVGELKGTNKVILTHLEEAKQYRDNTQHVITRTKLAESEVETTRQLTDIELRKARGLEEIKAEEEFRRDQLEARKARRANLWALTWKVVAALGAIWAFVSALYLGQCR